MEGTTIDNGEAMVRMAFGRHFGWAVETRDVGGFALGRFTPMMAKREVRLHRHEEAHFVFVLRGVYETSAAPPPDASLPRVIYSPPGAVHRDGFADPDLSRSAFASLSVPGEALAAVATESQLPDREVCLPASAIGLVHQLLTEAQGHDDLSGAIAEAHGFELLRRTGREREAEADGAPGWLRRACELLRDTACGVGPKSVAEIAGEVGVHPVHLARRFRRSFGMAPGEYVRRCRLERARRLMRRSTAPLAEIAAAAGFTDQSHFSNAFRKSFGISPGVFRRS
jgi:AraC family transcriptional regulator